MSVSRRDQSFNKSPIRIEGFGKFPAATDFRMRKIEANGFETTLKQQDEKLLQVRFGGKTPAEVDAANTHIDEKLFFQQKIHQSQLLDNDPLFRFLKGKLVSLTAQEQKGTTLLGRNFTKTLTFAIRKLVREVVLTKDRSMQKTYLSRVYQWVQQKLEEKESIADRAQSPALGKREAVKLPSLTELSRDYVIPNVIGYNQKGFQDSSQNLPYNPMQERSVNSRPLQDTSYISSGVGDLSTSINSPDRSKLRTSQFSRESPPSFQSRQIYTSQRPRGPYEVGGVSKASLHQSFLDKQRDSQSRISHSPERQQPTLSNTMSKVPIEARSNFVHYQPLNNEVEQKLESAWYLKKNAQVSQKRAMEEERRVVAEWGQNRARMEEEISRRIERQFFGANMESQGFVWKDQSKKPFEKSMNDYENAYNHMSSDEQTSISGEETDESPSHSYRTIDRSKLHKPEQKSEYYDMTMNENGDTEEEEEENQKKKKKTAIDNKTVPSVPNPNAGYGTQLPKLPETNLMDRIVYEAKKRKIEQLRRFQGGLIKATKSNNIDDINNIFVSSSNPKDVITLSVYNRAGYYLKNGKSTTGEDFKPKSAIFQEAGQATLHQSFNLQDSTSGGILSRLNHSMGEELSQEEIETYKQAAHFKFVRGVSEDPNQKSKRPGLKSLNHEYRMQQLGEIIRVKERLAKEDINCPISALQRAILLPQDKKNTRCYVQGKDNDDKEYLIAPNDNLIINPFKKVVKGKKKKGKKKKK